MSALGTLLAALAGLALALPASRLHDATRLGARTHARCCSTRCAPSRAGVGRLLLISAGLGPLAGTLALARAHHRRAGPAVCRGAGERPARPRRCAARPGWASAAQVFLYATLPQVLPQLLSYTLYRWENNIRAAAVLGVVGAGGLGQLLAFHMGLFHMGKTATILGPCCCWWRWWTPELACPLRRWTPATAARCPTAWPTRAT
jgi:phosphonate transport system permease protein